MQRIMPFLFVLLILGSVAVVLLDSIPEYHDKFGEQFLALQSIERSKQIGGGGAGA